MSTKPKVFIGIPIHKGDLSAATMMSVIQASSHHLDITYHVLGISLLAKNFNLLFTKAYTSGFDYFILLHSDIGVGKVPAGGSWVDYLVRVLIDLKAAAVSAVVPIKSQAGYTSTALQLEAKNPYNMRRLTVRETLEMPYECICRLDLCSLFRVKPSIAGPMLINTGCLVMDLKRFDWTTWPGFSIVDSLVWTKNGPQSYTIPEDWNFSTFLHESKWPYYATWGLRINHFGSATYGTDAPWGEATDTVLGQPDPQVRT